ncbi:TPA: hypothetical protein ACIEC3_002580 [Enterococcus faecium]
MKYIKNVETLEELKKAYKKLALKLHPDCGGSNEEMAQLNNEYDELFSIKDKINNCFTNKMKLKDRRNWFNEDGKHQDIRRLFEYMGKVSEYDHFYSRYSASSHGLSVLGQLSVSPQMFAIISFDDKSIILPVLNGYIFDITNEVITYYQLNEELTLYVQKIKNIVKNS